MRLLFIPFLYSAAFCLLIDCSRLIAENAETLSASSDVLCLKIDASQMSGSENVHLPIFFKEWQEKYGSVSVRSGKGEVLPFQTNMLSGRMIGLSFHHVSSDYPVIITLKKQQQTDQTAAAPLKFRQLVQLLTKELPLTTRGFTIPEMLRLAAHMQLHQKAASYRSELPGQLPADASVGRKLLNIRPRRCRLLLWNAHFFLDKSTAISPSVQKNSSAWMMLLDGRPLCGWKNASQSLVSLPAGYHRLQYFVFLNRGEKIPAPVILKNDPEMKQLHRKLLPWTPVRCFHFSQSKTIWNDFVLTSPRPVFWPRTGQCFRIWHLKLKNSGCSLAKQFVRNGDAGKNNFSLHWEGKDFSLQLPDCWAPPLPVSGHLRWGRSDRAQVFFPDDSLKTSVILDLSRSFSHELRNNLKLIIREKTAQGQIIAVHRLQADANRPVPFSKILSPRTRLVTLSAVYHGEQVLAGENLQILQPEDSLENIHLKGNVLYLDKNKILFRTPRPAELTCVRNLRSGKKSATSSNIYYFQNQYILPRQLPLAREYARPPIFQQIEIGRQAGSSSEQHEWIACSQLAQMKPDIALLNLQFCRLSSEKDFPVFFRKICFLTQYLCQRKIHPILLTPPAYAGENPELTRLQALYMKEFAWKYGLEILDFYSETRKKNFTQNSVHSIRSQVGYLDFTKEYQLFLQNYFRVFLQDAAD